MASDCYISSYDKANAKTTHINSAGAITAPMAYAVWDKVTKSALVVEATSAAAETSLRDLLTKSRNDQGGGRLCVITVPA